MSKWWREGGQIMVALPYVCWRRVPLRLHRPQLPWWCHRVWQCHPHHWDHLSTVSLSYGVMMKMPTIIMGWLQQVQIRGVVHQIPIQWSHCPRSPPRSVIHHAVSLPTRYHQVNRVVYVRGQHQMLWLILKFLFDNGVNDRADCDDLIARIILSRGFKIKSNMDTKSLCACQWQ